MTNDREGMSAEVLVETLCSTGLDAWRAAVTATRGDARYTRASEQVTRLSEGIDPARWWALQDELENAIFRFTTPEGVGVLHGMHDLAHIAETTQAAVAALAIGDGVDAGDREALTGRFGELVPGTTAGNGN